MQTREQRTCDAGGDFPIPAATPTAQSQVASPPLSASMRPVDLQSQAAAEFSFSRFVGRSAGSGFGALSQRGMLAAAASQDKERRPGLDDRSSPAMISSDSRPGPGATPSIARRTSNEEDRPSAPPTDASVRPAPIRPTQSKGRVSILAGAGPPPRVISSDIFGSVGSSSSSSTLFDRAYTPPNLHPVAPTVGPRGKATHRKTAIEGVGSLSPSAAVRSAAEGAGEGVDAVRLGAAAQVDPQSLGASTSQFPRLSPPVVLPDLDEAFQAVRDLVNQVSPVGRATGDRRPMSPVAEEHEETTTHQQSSKDPDLLAETNPLPEDPSPSPALGRHMSPGPPLTDIPPDSTSQTARPRKIRPAKSASRTGSGGSSASARLGVEPTDSTHTLEALEGSTGRIISHGVSGIGRAQLAASQATGAAEPISRTASGGVKRRRSRGDADRLDSGDAPADDLHGLIQAALRQADQKAEVIKTLTAENSTLKHSLKTMKAAVKETALRAQSVESLLETVQREARTAREHFNKSHNLLLDEVLELKSDVSGHRARLEDYFDSNDNWFQAMRDKVQDAVGPLHESLEAAKERAQSSAETVELLKRELSVKAGDLAERTARVQELEGRDGVKDAVITSKDEKLADLSSLAQSSRLQAVMLESQVEQLKETVSAAQADLARKDGDFTLCRETLSHVEKEADNLRHQLESAGRDADRAARENEELRQQLASVESRLVSTQVALGEEKGGRLALGEQLRDAHADTQRATATAGLAEQAKLQAESIARKAESALEAERKESAELKTQLDEARALADARQKQTAQLQERLAHRQEASGDKQAEVAAITARVEELESNLVASRTSAEEHKARACQLEKVIAEIEAGRDEAVVRLRAQLSEQEAAVREERQLSTMELADLREKAKEVAASNEETSRLRTKLKSTQDELNRVMPEVVELRAKQDALSTSIQRLDTQHKTIAERYRSNELDATEQAFIKLLKKTIEATNLKQQVDLENQLKRAERTIINMREEKLKLEKQWTKQLARSASGKTRDLVEDNALDQSSTPSSVPDQRRIAAEGSITLAVVESRTNSTSTEADGRELGRATSAGRLAALDDDDDDAGDGDEVAVESLVPKSSDMVPTESSSLGKSSGGIGKRPAPSEASGPPPSRPVEDRPPSAKKLRSSAPSDVGNSTGRASLGSGKTYKKAGGSSSRRHK